MGENHDQAMAVRRSVLGAEYVDRARSAAGVVGAPFQEFVTRWVWGEAWLDGTLDRRVRSLLTVAVALTMGRHDEVRLHLRGALRNGCTPREIGAMLTHVAVYAGAATAVAGVAIADEEVAAYTAETSQREAGNDTRGGHVAG